MKRISIFMAIMIVSILALPYSAGYPEFSDKNKVINDSNSLNGDNRIYVKFCYGKISGLYDFGSGYNHYIFYGFSAEDVICIINNTDRPLYHHLTGGVACAINNEPFLRGYVSDNFICANDGLLSPIILLLLYYIQKS
ncbi:MAG: hypothetical protein NTZ75_08555 [Euryarchaeota archaeon]|nr:hypothetical protein [Euryarchaeota archaeon]